MTNANDPLYKDILYRQQQARIAFGRMLLVWRQRNHWTQYTAHEWAKEAGFETISYGNLSVIERGKAGELRQKAFFQLEELNRRIINKQWGAIKSQHIKEKLKEIQPIQGDDDKVWDAVDFWSCYTGCTPVPTKYQK
jgi:hypothetical protein